MKNNKIFARGAADMKGSLIAFMMSVESLNGQSLPWDITLLVTTDEETDQKQQLDYLFKKLDGVRNATFLDIDSFFGYVSVGGLGHLGVKITLKGLSVHSGISHLGRNAIENAIPVLNQLLWLKKKVEKRFSKIPVNPKLKIKTMQAKFNINKISGGLKINIVPDFCEILIDRRLIPEENLTDARKEIIAVLKPLKKKIDFKLEFPLEIPGHANKSEVSERLSRAMAKVLGKGPFYGVMGSGDMTGFALKHSWQLAGCGVSRDKESNMHGDYENVRIEDMDATAEIFKNFLLDK